MTEAQWADFEREQREEALQRLSGIEIAAKQVLIAYEEDSEDHDMSCHAVNCKHITGGRIPACNCHVGRFHDAMAELKKALNSTE